MLERRWRVELPRTNSPCEPGGGSCGTEFDISEASRNWSSVGSREPDARPGVTLGPSEAAGADPSRSTVLIVEDSTIDGTLLERLLEAMHCRTERASDGQSALTLLAANPPQLVVLDLILPGIDGYELIQRMKSTPKLAEIPILVVSALSAVQERVRALELGADDFIVKGFDPTEFRVRVWRLLSLKRRIDHLNFCCEQAVHQAMTDTVTGLHNRAFLHEMLERELSFASRHSRQLSFVFCDIDHFKQINDQYGHVYGDEVLKAVGRTIRDTVRRSDTVARYGGDEFAALLPHTPRREACRLAERIRANVESLRIAVPAAEASAYPRITLSLGIANYPEDADDVQLLLHHSDQALYAAKRSGRNNLGGTENHVELAGRGCPPEASSEEGPKKE